MSTANCNNNCVGHVLYGSVGGCVSGGYPKRLICSSVRMAYVKSINGRVTEAGGRQY